MPSTKHLIVSLFAALMALPVQATTLEEGKSLGQSLGASGAAQAPGVTESATTINSTLGHESTQGAGSGAGYDRGYTGAATYAGKLACAEGRTAFFGGLGLKVASCTVSGGSVTKLQLSACTSARDGAACQWGAPQTLLNPGSTSFGGFAVNTNCPAGGTVCEVSVRETASQSWNADTVAEEGRQAVQAEGPGGFYDTMNTTYNDGGYRASLSAVGPQYSGCVEQVDAGLASDGIVYSCDGLQSASFDSACEETRECVRTEQQITRYDVDCVSGVDLVEQSCTTVTPTKDCEVSIEKQTYSCNKTLTVVVTGSGGTPSCQQGTWYHAWSGVTFASNVTWHVYAYCDNYRTDGKMTFQFRKFEYNAWRPEVHTNVISVAPGPSGFAYINDGWAYRAPGVSTYCDEVHYSGACDANNNCSISFRYRNICSSNAKYRGPWYIQANFVKPHLVSNYTVSDHWTDSCATYENAM